MEKEKPKPAESQKEEWVFKAKAGETQVERDTRWAEEDPFWQVVSKDPKFLAETESKALHAGSTSVPDRDSESYKKFREKIEKYRPKTDERGV